MKIVTESAIIDNPQGFSRTKKISVQSSFKLNLPPPLIFEASTIKLDETIGQGKNYKHNGQRTVPRYCYSEHEMAHCYAW